MNTLQDALAQAVAHHKAGRLAEAELLYRSVIEQAPDNVPSLIFLAKIYLRWRRLDEADALLARAVAVAPQEFRVHATIGDARQRRADFKTAIVAYRRCLELGGDEDSAAKIDSCEFAVASLADALPFDFRADLWTYALGEAKRAGLVLEFGVAGGVSLRFIAERAGQKVYGFDSFGGLPSGWRPGYEAGTFRQAALPDLASNAELVVGLFADTVAPFLAEHGEAVRFAHIDCDLYASAQVVLDRLSGSIGPGTVLVFDDYLNYVGWRDGEYRAFAEFLAHSKLRADYLGYVPGGMQVAAIIR